MRAFAAVVVLAACSIRCRAHGHVPSGDTPDTIPRLLSTLGISQNNPLHRIVKCATTVGPAKCLSAFSAWRAQNAIDSLETRPDEGINLAKDIRRFPWENYTNSTQDQVYSQLCDGTEKLLQIKSLDLNMIPGYEFKLASNGNGTLNVDILQSKQIGAARGMKKMKKAFYNIVPFLLLPGLIMSAILPFVLPALKMMTLGVGMLNNMALSGAVFTLLRNNAFNDKYEHKVIYVNEGYKNEKIAYNAHHETHADNEGDFQYDNTGINEFQEHLPGYGFGVIEEAPSLGSNFDEVTYNSKKRLFKLPEKRMNGNVYGTRNPKILDVGHKNNDTKL